MTTAARYWTLIFLCLANLKGLAATLEKPTEVTSDNYYNLMVSSFSGGGHEGYIKFSVLLDTSGKVGEIYFQSQDIKYHQQFLNQLPGTPFYKLNPSDTAVWRQLTMLKAGRRALLGSLSFRSSPDSGNSGLIHRRVDVQFLSEDPLAASEVAPLLKVVRDRIKLDRIEEHTYWPDSFNQAFVREKMADFASAGIKIFSPNQELKQYCYSSGWIAGPVKKVKASDLPGLMSRGEIDPSTVLVMDEAPRDLPMLTGLIVSQVSSEASHPALQAQAAGVPFVYIKDAFTDPSWDQLDRQGRSVFVQSRVYMPGTCQLVVKTDQDLSAKEFASLQELHRPLPVSIQAPDLNVTQLLKLDQLSEKNLAQVGGKAANLARLRKLIGPEHSVEKGLAIPLSYYHRFLREATTPGGEKLICGVRRELLALGAQLAQFGEAECGPAVRARATEGDLNAGLERVRTLIEGAEIEGTNALKAEIETALRGQWAVGTRLRFRSSANVEDGMSINAAGAYDSGSACLGDDSNSKPESVCSKEHKKSPIWKRVKKVWASLYSLKGFSIRQRYAVEESKAAMGVVVHRPFSDELANGVAVTQLSSEGWRPTRIVTMSTGFPGEMAVTNPPNGKLPETVRLDFEDDYEKIKFLVYSTEIPVGQRLLPDAMYEQLAQLTKKVHQYYEPLYAKDPTKYQLDFEWKLEGQTAQTQKIVIKQVRPVPIPEFGSPLKGRGSFVVGERAKRLCPVASENPDGLAKLKLSKSLRINVGLHELPANPVASLPNPLESLEWDEFNNGNYRSLPLTKQVRLNYEAWTETADKLKEEREVQAIAEVTFDSEVYELLWVVRQKRTKSVPEYLTESLGGFSEAHLWLRPKSKLPVIPEGLFQSYRVVEGQGICEQDAYQGGQPGNLPDHGRPAGKLRRLDWTMLNAENKPLEIHTEGRTSYGGYDKTSFVHLDQVTVKGVLKQDLVVRGGMNAVYAPAHHNFAEQLAVDLYKAEGLSSAQKAELVKLNLRYLVLPKGGTNSGNGGGGIGIGIGISSSTSQPRKVWVVEGVSDDYKKRKIIGRVFAPREQFH